MRWIGLDIYRKCRYGATESCWTDAEAVDLLQHLVFELLHICLRRLLMKLTGQRFLRHQRALFEVAADTDANNHRRTGIRACVLYSR